MFYFITFEAVDDNVFAAVFRDGQGSTTQDGEPCNLATKVEFHCDSGAKWVVNPNSGGTSPVPSKITETVVLEYNSLNCLVSAYFRVF